VEKTRRIFWIGFAFAFFIICFGGLIVSLRQSIPIGYVPTIVTLPALVALFAYAFRKKVWQSGVYVWRIYFFLYIAFCVYQDWNLLADSRDLPVESWVEYGISLIIIILSFIGVYCYSFRFLELHREQMR
jgi:hypothetical protein